jgi:tetratricopeptide (TPR) repeat protein
VRRLSENPDDADARIWFGRRLGYLGRYTEAIAIFGEGVRRHPEDARFLRHRGHRLITMRRLQRAEDDLRRAAEMVEGQPDVVEPDGLPNARNQPTSTLQTNIYYHLGLAHYLQGEFEQALAAYEQCRIRSHNPDMLSATLHWQFTTLRRLGRDAEAMALLEPITADMDIIENGSYHRLLLLFKGDLPADSLRAALEGPDLIENVTVGYGVSMWHYLEGRTAEAEAVWRQLLEAPQWAGFGYIAAEAEVARLEPTE